MGCIHQKIDDIYHEGYCELNNRPCWTVSGCKDRDDLTPTLNSTTQKWEIIEKGQIKEVEEPKPEKPKLSFEEIEEKMKNREDKMWADKLGYPLEYYQALRFCMSKEEIMFNRMSDMYDEIKKMYNELKK